MKAFISPFLLLIIFFLSFNSCKEESKDPPENRYKNSIWFVPEGETEGRWVVTDYSKGSELLTSGHCTEFYHNGKERIKYTLDHRGEKDTIFYYDLDSVLTHYSIGPEDDIKNYFYHDGDFTSYLWDGSAEISGIVRNHHLTEISWQGKMGSFHTLVSSKTYVWRGFEGFLHKLSASLKEAYQKEEKYIPSHEISSLDSLRVTLIDSIVVELTKASELEVEADCEKIKESSIQFMGVANLLLEEECEQIIQIMQGELKPESFDAIYELTQSMIHKADKADRVDEKIFVEWARDIKPGDFLVAYLEKLN